MTNPSPQGQPVTAEQRVLELRRDAIASAAHGKAFTDITVADCDLILAALRGSGQTSEDTAIAADDRRTIEQMATECHAAGYATPDGTLLPMFRTVAADAELGRAVRWWLGDESIPCIADIVDRYRAFVSATPPAPSDREET